MVLPRRCVEADVIHGRPSAKGHLFRHELVARRQSPLALLIVLALCLKLVKVVVVGLVIGMLSVKEGK